MIGKAFRRKSRGVAKPTLTGDGVGKKRTDKEKPAPDAEWFRARLHALKITQRRMAEMTRMHPSAFSRGLAGGASFSVGDVISLARELRSPVVEIMSRLGYDTRDVGGAGAVFRGRILETGQVSPVFELSGEAAPVPGYDETHEAFVIEAASGPLAIYNRATLVAGPASARGVDLAHVGRLCIIDDARQPLPLLGSIGQGGKGGNSLHVLGTAESVQQAKIVRTRLVRAIIL